uniref:Uncharacterized protein n=1 Tax=Ditylenchus dipsaci TaxID=166011 RepID=A0A915DVC4_9BILA
MEMLCGDEIRFLNEEQMHEKLVERKILAARFLAPLLDILYRSDQMIGDQPMHMSIQLLFMPYIRSTSIYRKLGAAIVVNCFARVFRRASVKLHLNNRAAVYPTLLVKEVEGSVWMPVKVMMR